MKIATKQLVTIGVILTTAHVVFFSGYWMHSNVSAFDVVYGSWLALFMVWLNADSDE